MNTPDPITRLNAALEGRQQVEREIGKGGMATVFLAKDLKHRKVALKVLKTRVGCGPGRGTFSRRDRYGAQWAGVVFHRTGEPAS